MPVRQCGALTRSTPSRTYLVDNGYPSLPDDEAHPGLIKIFFDAQHDYLQDHVYLLAGMVVGPPGKENRGTVHRTAAHA